jgi:hypothetical protein
MVSYPPPDDEDDSPRIQRVSPRYQPVADTGEDEMSDPVRVPRPSTSTDPTLGLLVGFALSIGLIALIPENADLRYTLISLAILAFAGFAWLLGSTDRIGRESAVNLAWGAGFGLLVGVPVFIAGGSILTAATRQLFRTGIEGAVVPLPGGVVLAYLVFVIPTAETLMFRGLLQSGRSFLVVGIVGSLWSGLFFLPMVDLSRFPIVALILAVLLTLFNMTYAYVRQRNGLAAAWLTQVLINVLVFYLPYSLR